jgi:hypothetical protein
MAFFGQLAAQTDFPRAVQSAFLVSSLDPGLTKQQVALSLGRKVVK